MRRLLALLLLLPALPASAARDEVLSAPFRLVDGVEVVAPPVSNGSVVGPDDQPGVTTVLRLTGDPREVAEAFAEQVCSGEYADGATTDCRAERVEAAGAEAWQVWGYVPAGGPSVRVEVRREDGADEGLVLLVHGGDSCGVC